MKRQRRRKSDSIGMRRGSTQETSCGSNDELPHFSLSNIEVIGGCDLFSGGSRASEAESIASSTSALQILSCKVSSMVDIPPRCLIILASPCKCRRAFSCLPNMFSTMARQQTAPRLASDMIDVANCECNSGRSRARYRRAFPVRMVKDCRVYDCFQEDSIRRCDWEPP